MQLAQRPLAQCTFAHLDPGSVAVFRALRLGDLLCAMPALRALRSALPRARVTLISLPSARQLVGRFSAYIDDYIAFPGAPGLPEQQPSAERLASFLEQVRAMKFDLALQMHGDGRVTNPLMLAFGARASAGFCRPGAAPGAAFLPYPARGHELRRLLALMQFLGAQDACEDLEFPLLLEDRAELSRFAPTSTLVRHTYACVHAGARAAERRWPAARFAEAADWLQHRYGLRIVLTGSEEERDLADSVIRAMRTPAVNAAGPISAGALACLIAGARLLLTNDTGVSHLAAALRVPSVVIFRGSDIARWAPLDSRRHRPVWDPFGVGLREVLRNAGELLLQPEP
jgi:ADP-heptose:LPS heptosyltransferase